MPASGPEAAVQRPSPLAFPPRGPLSREGRLWLTFRSAVVAVQVAWLTLVGWIGATLALVPLALRGAPAGRAVRAGPPRLVRLLARPGEALTR